MGVFEPHGSLANKLPQNFKGFFLPCCTQPCSNSALAVVISG